MTPEQWAQARALFEQAADIPPADLPVWLRAQTRDSVVIDEVHSLLAVDSRAGAFLSEPVLPRVGSLMAEDAGRFAEGESLGPYLIARELGRGGMGHVYLATDTRLGRQVALKVLAPRYAADHVQRERLRREARAAAALSHPGICTVYALEELDDEVVIATEYVEGRTLREECESGVRPTTERLLQTARELATALDAAHRAGVTHRDLKPENVMRAGDGHLKILDFGLALMDERADVAGPSPRVTTPGMLVGTPLYMAPEQIEGAVAGPGSDIWALGVLLYEFATGTHPFSAATPLALAARILESRPAPIASLRPDLPDRLAQVIQQCLQRRVGERLQSALDVVLILDAESQPIVSEQVRWWRIHQGAAIALYVVAVLVAWLVLLRSAERAADAAFVFVMVVATIGGLLRGHLLFAHRMYDRRTFLRELQQASTPLLAVDCVLGAGLVTEGFWVALSDAVPGALIAGFGLGVILTRIVLERSTTDAAFTDGPATVS